MLDQVKEKTEENVFVFLNVNKVESENKKERDEIKYIPTSNQI